MSSNRTNKSYKICNVLGGLDAARFVSSNTRQVFKGAIEDVELIREYVSLAASNQGIVGGMSSLSALNNSLDWRGRGLEEGTTTFEVGLGYSDDRSDRMIDRFVSTAHQPIVGDKETDMRIADTLSNLFPWIVDRRSVEKSWYKPHQNGRSEGEDKEPLVFNSLYTAAWLGSYGNAWSYYPPLSFFGEGSPFNFGDLLGGDFETHELPYIKPNLPENNPTRRAFLIEPYPDVAQPGLSLITALAPVYLTGQIGNYSYNETYYASTGLDIAVDSTSFLLDILLDTMTASSFAVITDMNFNTIVISQAVVDRLYPPRTGFESSRVTYSEVDDSILEDRRNQTYKPSDTIHQALTQLENADWTDLLQVVNRTRRGERGISTLNLTLTGELEPREFSVMYERWADVADWIMLAFAPTNDIEHAIDVQFFDEISNETLVSINLLGQSGIELFGEATMTNVGVLDVLVAETSIPIMFDLVGFNEESPLLRSGESMPIHFNIDTTNLAMGESSFLLTFTVDDDDYPDCFYHRDLNLGVTITILPTDCAALTGDPLREVDDYGRCVCSPTSLDVGGKCIHYAVLLPAILVPLLLAALLCVERYVDHKRKQADSIWRIKPTDLLFEEEPEILGRGTFGLVVRAEYRGTFVAVKRVIPSLLPTNEKSNVLNRLGSISSFGDKPTHRRDSRDHFEFSRKSALYSLDGSSNADPPGKVPAPRNPRDMVNSSDDQNDIPILTNKKLKKLKRDFICEMRLLSKLRHPCITTVMGAVLSPGKEPLLVMELMDHGSLFDLLHNETVIVEGSMVLQILRDVAQGLRFLHAANPQVIHGDLKAQNILVDSKFRAKVADFGLSQKKFVGATGTPFWMSPELLRGISTNTAASDVYSFGIILYEVYSRKVPYDGEDFDEAIKQICDPYTSKRPPVPTSMPPEVITLMTACTNAHPDIRPSFHFVSDKLKSFDVDNVEPGQMHFSKQTKKSWDTTLTASENLLLDIFPKHVAEALSQGQKVEPQHFDCVTIFFSDIVGFTAISHAMSPFKVSDMLDRLYIKFDQLSRQHDVFKVETIGDAWMGVTNVASPQPDHAKRIVAFAMDAIRAANITMVDQEDSSKGFIKIRVGFHSGPVIASVVGSRNPKYTLIGDTVNTSSRMESNSHPGCILCSKAAAKLVAVQAPEYSVVSRGVIEVKGKGSMETFWVAEGLLPEDVEREGCVGPKPSKHFTACMNEGWHS